jgi:hypothetical protein
MVSKCKFQSLLSLPFLPESGLSSISFSGLWGCSISNATLTFVDDRKMRFNNAKKRKVEQTLRMTMKPMQLINGLSATLPSSGRSCSCRSKSLPRSFRRKSSCLVETFSSNFVLDLCRCLHMESSKSASFVASLSSPQFAGALKASTTSSSMRANKNNCAKFQGLQSHIQAATNYSEVLLGIMTRWMWL